ncbi:MAG: DUF427 domain-containing protein [Pseudomonadota bacterium]
MEPVGPGEESVWDFPRPPRVEAVEEALCVEFARETIAETARGLRVVETSGAPVYYFPPSDVMDGVLRTVEGAHSVCEWKGVATYFDLVVGGRVSKKAAFTYPDPLDDLGEGYERLAGLIAFYANRVDAAWVGETRATPQPGGFYAGWVTPRLKGPIKGEPGSEGW